MKNLFIFIFCISNFWNSYAQNLLFDKQDMRAIKYIDNIIYDASEIFDDTYNNMGLPISTNNNATWLQINTKCIRKISTLKIYSPSTDYYVFLSKAPFYHVNLEALIRDPWVYYVNITGDGNGSNSTTIPIPSYSCQYILLVSSNVIEGSIQGFKIDEIDIYGDYGNCGPYIPKQNPPILGPPLSPPYGTCGPWPPYSPPSSLPPDIIGTPWEWVDPIGVWPWWSTQEICGDGIDNDNNGLTDCEDYPCGVGTFNVVHTNPTCPICQNGKICIYANNNVVSVSIDDGVTWVDFPSDGFYCFENLNVGTYYIKLRSEFDCEAGSEITLMAPEGEDELCENGGFESGTFNNWEGGITQGYGSAFTNTTLDINNRHTIQQNNFIDPYASFISGMQGSYCAKLGNTNVGSESERLTYCFEVDNTNKNLSFNYAAVLEIPENHLYDNLPYVQYKIYRKSTGTIIGQNKVDTQNPYVVKSGIVNALGWDCIDADLTAFIGEEVCVEFISSDCGCGGHFGYGYIDGICSKGGNNINISLNANLQYCGNQDIPIDVIGIGYSQFKWTISKIDASGSEFDIYEGLLQNGFNADLDDVKKLYEDNSNYTFTCPQKYKVKFDGFSGCGSGNSEIIFDYLCNEYNIDYCNPFYICVANNQNQIQIQGINDCDNCQYIWSSPQGLSGMINTTSKFPTLDKSLNYLAFTKLYELEVITPEGCKYIDTFQGKYGTIDINLENVTYGYCAYSAVVNINFSTPVNIDDASIIAINTINNELVPFTISGGGTNYSLSFSLSRNTASRVSISVDYDDIGCSTGNCIKNLTLPAVNPPLFSQWKAAWPTNFKPDGDGVNDYFFIVFRSVDENRINCADINLSNSSVYSYRLEIFDRWGNLVFDQTIAKDVLDTQGILGDEIKWGGNFKSQSVATGVYTWKATVQSCYDGANPCNDCGNTAGHQKCGTSSDEIFTGTIEVDY